MTIYLAYESATSFWQHCPWPGDEPLPEDTSFAVDASSYLPNPQRIAHISSLCQAGVSAPFHLLVGQRGRRLPSLSVCPHCSKAALPAGSFVRLSEDVSIASPELSFFEFAASHSLPLAVRYGMQLCGTFGIGAGTGWRFDRGQVTTARRLQKFVETMSGTYGSARALRAARWVLDGSASPMESNQAIIMFLPPRMGGYGVRRPQLNHRIDVGAHGARVARKSWYVCDVFWPSAKLDVEYDSDEYHTGPNQVASDSARRAALDYMGISVITVTRQQLMDAYEFNRLMRLVAKKLGQRINTSTSIDIMERRKALRGELFSWR